MRNETEWRPTKFVQGRAGWQASRDPSMVARSSRLAADRQSAAYARAVTQHARGNMLDLGCGDVPLYGAYREFVTSTTTADWKDGPHSQHIDHYVDLSRDSLPFLNASFDTVVLTDVLEHLVFPDQLLAEMTRVLRPGGKLIIGVPFLYVVHEQPHDHHRYTEYRLRAFCEDHDLDVLECRPYGAGFDVLLDVASKLMAGSRLTRWASGLPAALWRRPGVRPQTMPLGYLLVATPA